MASRRQINIKGVQDGVLILPGNRYRIILQASPINFELKSEAEQDVLIETYQSFLNSLACPLQILVRTREVDMEKYLEDFQTKLEQEKEAVYKAQIKHYADFVRSLVTTNKILTRHFYVVIPHDTRDGTDFSLVKEQLALNYDIVSKGLGRLGMQTRQLTSLEVLNMFYSFYSPRRAKQQPLTDKALNLMNESYVHTEQEA